MTSLPKENSLGLKDSNATKRKTSHFVKYSVAFGTMVFGWWKSLASLHDFHIPQKNHKRSD